MPWSTIIAFIIGCTYDGSDHCYSRSANPANKPVPGLIPAVISCSAVLLACVELIAVHMTLGCALRRDGSKKMVICRLSLCRVNIFGCLDDIKIVWSIA